MEYEIIFKNICIIILLICVFINWFMFIYWFKRCTKVEKNYKDLLDHINMEVEKDELGSKK